MRRKRLLNSRVELLAKHFPVIAITGARQVGKTTFLKELFGPDFGYVVFKQGQGLGLSQDDPDLFLKNYSTPLILDEIQYVPELVASIKVAVDEDRKPGMYFLTGSQQWSVIKSMSESLAGRVAILNMDGLCVAELAGVEHSQPWLSYYLDDPEGFLKQNKNKPVLERTLFDQLWRGFLPFAQDLPEGAVGEFHQAYYDTYVSRDIRSMAEVEDWKLFRRFVQMLAAMSSQEVNYSQLGRDIGITPQTAIRWTQLLDATFQWFEINAFSRNTLKRLSKKTKGYMSDTGALCFLQGIASPTTLGGHPLWGPVFETAVVGELRKQIHAMEKKPLMYHWRAHSGAEVDLLLERDGRFYLIEIKGKTNPTRGDTTGMSAFRKTYPDLDIAPGLVIGACDHVFPLSKDDWAMPWNLVISY